MSQFTVYKSSDTGAPLLYGATSSMIAVLDAILVNGYGTQPGAGWQKPIPNFTGSNGQPVYACYQLPSGSSTMSLFINDNNPNASSGKEATATGWEVLTSLSSSVTNTVGTGSGQFPTPAQSLTTGHVTIRKSVTVDSSSARPWTAYADSGSFYFFAQTGDSAGVYYVFSFGDIYSFKGVGVTDAYKCMIMGRSVDNAATVTNDGFDNLSAVGAACTANFMARSYTGIGGSITIGKHGDGVKGSTGQFNGNTVAIPYPNTVDAGFYISPVWICEPATSVIRGYLRGIYQPLHASSNFNDGTTYTGGLDFAGKTFQVVKSSPNSGVIVVETSNTVLTN